MERNSKKAVLKNAAKKILCLVLTLGLFLTAVPANVWAAEAETELFDIKGSSMTLGNTLEINFAIDTTKLTGTDNYIVISKEYADDRGTVTKTVQQSDWTRLSATTSYVSYSVTAKEMNDKLTVVAYNAAGEQLTNIYEDSVAAYCLRTLAKEEAKENAEAKKLALFVDMVNYGAAAQEEWDYNTDSLANAGLTETQKGYATQVGEKKNILEEGEGYYGTSLSLKENILMNVAYKANEISDAAYAVVSFVDHYGNDESVKVQAEEFIAQGSNIKYISIAVMAVADYSQAVTVTLYDAEGNAISTTVDSVESYLSRKSGALYDAIAAFGVGAYNYFHTTPNTGDNTTVITGTVSAQDGTVTQDTSFSDGDVSAQVPAGVQVEDTTLTLTVTEKSESDSGVALEAGQEILPLDIHIEGVSAENATPIQVCLGKILPNGLNIGNVTLYHVENGVANEMIRVMTLAELDEHNEFYYDPATGDITVAMASFSEVAMVSEEPVWNGERDYTWYNTTDKVFEIVNADQLAGLSAIVGGMATYKNDNDETITINQDSFNGKTIKLIGDINIGDLDSGNGIVFYPIGYWNSEGTYEKDTENATEALSSGFYTFEGTFDGQGHTISNFYQNTWEMKGDHDWYDPIKEQCYRDGMGLFGKVYGGTVKNLTVKNFSSDGEITTTGTIAAYAEGATFENIAIFDCNPRVYNIGNGGIVGCVGWYAKEADLKTTFTNITVDNSNKISALWGSWDVACGGLVGQYYPTSGQSSAEYPANGGIHMENCHVAAQIDVYNDVCANYQYYAYRYAGMLIGSVRENVTIDGHSYPKMDGIEAKDCTVHFGDWNDYYYCELVANSLASYTHDHQFSRLEQVADVNTQTKQYLPLGANEWKDIPNGRQNYVVVNVKGEDGKFEHATENATCYHFVDGKVHDHDDYNGDGVEDYETVNGESIRVENNRHIYLEFNNLVTGYGWGVTSRGFENLDGVELLDVEHTDNEKSVEKFIGKDVAEIAAETDVKIGDLFAFVDTGIELKPEALTVGITDLDDTDGTATATFTPNAENWADGTLTVNGTGKIAITIQDYYFCTPTTIEVTVTERQPVEKFDKLFTGDFLYRVGNDDSTHVKLGSLFKAKDGAEIGTVSVSVEAIDGTGASGTYTSDATWTNGTINFDGTGIVKVTITDNDYCVPTELLLEVVDAKNATAAASATANNVVLLNNISGGFTVSGRYAVYGNGFTCYYTDNGQYLNNGLKQGIITVSENGTLDNLRIEASIYPAAYLYYEEVQSGPSTVDGDKTRYHYQLSAVLARDNATITNCYIYGGRNNIFVNTGNVTIKDSVLECGSLANIQIQSNSSHTVTLENVTTIQHQVTPTVGDTSQVMFGAGVVVGPETNDNPAIVLNGYFKQYNWVNAADKSAVTNATARKIIDTALTTTAFNHTVNGATASNLGIIFLNEYTATVENNTGLPYKLESVSLMGESGQVYSLQGATAEQIYSNIEGADKTTENDYYIPQFKYDSTLGGQYVAETDGADAFCYREGDTIKVMFPSGDTKELDLAALVNIAKYSGQDLGLAITCTDGSGNPVTVTGGKIMLSAAGEYTVTYSVTDTVFYNKNGETLSKEIPYSWKVTISVSLKDTAVPDAYFDYVPENQVMGYAQKSIFAGGNTQYLPFLAGLQIYDYVGQNSYLRFDGDNDFNKVAAVEITGYTSANHVLIKVTLTDGGIINIDTTARAASGGSTYTGKIQTNGNTIYYVNDGTTSATTTTWVISNYTFTGNNGVEISSGAVTFANCTNGSVPTGSFSTTINYTVTYDANGGDCGQTLGYATSAAAAVTLPTATRSGYTFLGWYTAATGGDKIGAAEASYTPSANITLYAQWGAPCTVTYDANGGSCDTTSEKFDGKTLILPEATRDGYTFTGWYTAATGGDKIGMNGESYNPSADITLYAQWIQPITVTYDANGGTCGTTSELYKGDLKLPTPDTRPGYTFLGWYTAATGGTLVGAAGESYEPTADITLYAQWDHPSYTITINQQSNATVTVDKTEAYYGETVSVTVSFSKNYNKTLTVKDASENPVLSESAAGTYTFTMPESNVTIEASSSSTCVTGDTLVTLADGSQKRIDEVTYEDQFLVWNFYTGTYDYAPASIIQNHGYGNQTIATLIFDDGTTINTINGHGFFHPESNKYVILDENNAEDYIGHSFIKQDSSGYSTVKLVDFSVTEEYTESWSILTAKHYNAFLEGMFTLTPAEAGNTTEYLMPFALGEGLKYDETQMQADIEQYGLYTYKDFEEYMTYEQFAALNLEIFKISVGKGYITWDDIMLLVDLHIPQ